MKGSLFPHHPWRLFAFNKPVQVRLIAHGVHALPETAVFICGKLIFYPEFFKYLPLKYAFIALYMIKYFRFQNHETAVNPTAVFHSLFKENRFSGTFVYFYGPKTPAGLNRGNSGYFFLFPVKSQQFTQINICHTVPVCEHKSFIARIFAYYFYAAAGHCVIARIHKGDFPGFGHIIMHYHLVLFLEVKCHIGTVKVIIGKILLYQIAFITAADYKIIMPEMRIIFHYMP